MRFWRLFGPPRRRSLAAWACLLLSVAISPSRAATSFNETAIQQYADHARHAGAPSPAHAPAPRPQPPVNPQTYLLTVQLGGREAVATPPLIGVTQGTLSDTLHSRPEDCQIVEAANVTVCINGAPSPAPASEMFFPPQPDSAALAAYLQQIWRSTSDQPAPPFNVSGNSGQLDFTQYNAADPGPPPQPGPMDPAPLDPVPMQPGPAGRRRLLHRDPSATAEPRTAAPGMGRPQSSGSRRLHNAGTSGCLPEAQLTLRIALPAAQQAELWNTTLEFFVSGRFLAKMQSRGVDLVNAQLLGYQEPGGGGSSPMPARPGPNDHTPPVSQPHTYTFGPQPGVQQPNASSPLEFSLQVVGDDAQVTNDSLLGALYNLIVTPSPLPGSRYLNSNNTAITVIRQGALQSVGVALGRRRRLLTLSEAIVTGRLRALLQQSGQAPPPMLPGSPPSAQYNVSKPSMEVTFRLQSVPAQSASAVKDAVTALISNNVLLRGFQNRGISVYQVSLQSFNFQPAAAPQSGPQAPPPFPVIPTRKSSSGPRTTIIVVAVVPVSVLIIALGIFAYFWYRRHQRQPYLSPQESQQKLKMKESELSGVSSVSDHFSVREMSVAAIIGQMHPPRVAQGSFLDMTWSDWRIASSELTILTRPDGSEWLLGSGASGRVYKALRNGVQIVAVKLFKEEMTRGAINSLTSPKHAEQFRREISILKSCHDKNIVQFLGAVLADERTILVTEYLENGDLYNAINSQQGGRYHWYRMQQAEGRPVPNSGMARRVALDVARGLHFLHTKKIVHFDLKSANILLARDFTAKIADVGLARILKDDMLSTRKEVGTFAWAAPEVLLGQRTSEAADIYSFGVLLHELSALESPSGRHLRRLKVPEECPPEVSDLMFRCLDPNQHNRPSARDLVAVLSCLPAVPPFAPQGHSRHNSFSRHSFTMQHPSIQQLHVDTRPEP